MAATILNPGDPRAVTVDLSSRRLQILHHGVRLRRFGTIKSLPDRYVELVRQVRGMQGGRFTIRDADLQMISASTGVPVGWLDDEIRRAMEAAGWSVPGVGLATTSGLVLAAGLGISSRGLVTGGDTMTMGGGDTAVASASAASNLVVEIGSEVQVSESGLAVVTTDVGALPTLDTAAATQAVTALATQAGTASSSTSVDLGGETASEAVTSVDATTTATAAAPEISASEATLTQSATAVVETARPRHETVGAEAMTLISYDIETLLPGWTIDFQPGRTGLLGFAYFEERRIEVYVRDSHSAWDVASTLAHELGHAVDVSILDDAARWDWMNQRGIDADWWPAPGVADYSSGAGDFAEAFAVWQVGGSTHSRVAGAVTDADLQLLQRLAG